MKRQLAYFCWAVNSNHMLDASLGYYINPLINVLLGMFFMANAYANFNGLPLNALRLA